MADNQSVDELLNAEKQANELIKKAQKERENKLKNAKISADQEINIYKKEEEKKFQDEINRRFGSNNDEEVLNRQTEEEIRKIEQDFLRNKETVIDMLVNRIIDVKLEIPEVMRGNFE